MSATIQQVVDYAASNVPAAWGEIINACTFPDANCYALSGKIRILCSDKPVLRKANLDAVWAHGETETTGWASNHGWNGAGDKLLTLGKCITIVKNNRTMRVFVKRIPGVGFTVTISVKQN